MQIGKENDIFDQQYTRTSWEQEGGWWHFSAFEFRIAACCAIISVRKQGCILKLDFYSFPWEPEQDRKGERIFAWSAILFRTFQRTGCYECSCSFYSLVLSFKLMLFNGPVLSCHRHLFVWCFSGRDGIVLRTIIFKKANYNRILYIYTFATFVQKNIIIIILNLQFQKKFKQHLNEDSYFKLYLVTRHREIVKIKITYLLELAQIGHK